MLKAYYIDNKTPDRLNRALEFINQQNGTYIDTVSLSYETAIIYKTAE